jgi:tetratricopeptide (TPR) repeat protein
MVLACSCMSFSQPQNPVEEQRQKALLLERSGRESEARQVWQEILKAHPANPEAYAHLGVLEAHRERYSDAVAYYRKALELNPSVTGVRLNLALALFKEGQLEVAIPEFRQVLDKLPRTSAEAQRTTILIGMSYYGVGKYAAAIPYLKDAATQDARDLPLRLALAHSCLWSKETQCVLDVYHQILELNAESAEADMLAGEAMDEMKDQAGAISMFRAAVKANPHEPNAHFGLGYLLWEQKQYAEAETEFKAELANDPAHTQAMLYLADGMIQMRRMDEARPWLEKVVSLDAKNGLGHLDLGIVCAENGQNQDALRELTEAEKLIPEEVNVHWRLGRLYRALGRRDDAKAEFDKAATLNKATDADLANKIEMGKQHGTPAQAAPEGK